jgi:hypothetical protein
VCLERMHSNFRTVISFAKWRRKQVDKEEGSYTYLYISFPMRNLKCARTLLCVCVCVCVCVQMVPDL